MQAHDYKRESALRPPGDKANWGINKQWQFAKDIGLAPDYKLYHKDKTHALLFEVHVDHLAACAQGGPPAACGGQCLSVCLQRLLARVSFVFSVILKYT